MRRYLLLAGALVLSGALSACGGGGSSSSGGGTVTHAAPTILNLVYGPTATYVSTGGTEIVHGEFDFSDPDGDLASLTLEALDGSGNVIDSVTGPLSGVAGVKSGTIQVDVEADTSTVGVFTMRVRVTDSRGLVSNTLTGTFRVSEFPWVARKPMPLARRDFATAMVGGRIYVLGGGDSGAPVVPSPATATVQVYDPATDAWTAAAPMPVAARNHAAAVVGGRIYVAGGESDTAPGLRTLQVYDPVTDTWAVRADMPYELRGNAATGADGLLFVFGGDNLGFDTANALAYDPATDAWASRATMLRPGRNMAAVAVGGKPLVLGGYSSSWTPDAGYFRLVAQYDPAANSWTAGTDMYTPRSDCAVAVIDTTVYVAGGGNWERALADVAAYDVATNQWRARTPMPVALAWPRAEVVNGKVYVFDGSNTLEYTPANDIM